MASRSKKRQSQAVYESDDAFDDSEDQSHAKKPRTEGKPSSNSRSNNRTSRALSSGAGKVDANGDVYWEISRLRRVTVSEFRGRTMVNIREYYEKDGNELPGKKVRLAYFYYAHEIYRAAIAIILILTIGLSPSGNLPSS